MSTTGPEGETHVTTNEARGGTTTRSNVRYILMISLVLVIVVALGIFLIGPTWTGLPR